MAAPGGCAPKDAADGVGAGLDRARTYLRSAARDAGLSGVVLIGRGEEIVLEEAYGLADAELQVPMRTNHRFRIGSLTKPVTASAVLVAVDRGVLALDQRVCRLLPTCPRSWEPVTVRHLLTHSSGIADHFGDLEAVPVEATAKELRRVLEALPPDEALRAAPGSEYAYSNFNYVLLGAVLERVAGLSWEAILRQWVFAPLGLKATAYDAVYAIMEDRVRGYTRHDSLGLRNIDYDDHAAYAAGGLLSSAGDLFRWSRGVFTGRLFSPRLVQESLTPHAGDYGYGWQTRKFFDRTVHNHTGGIDGFSSHLAHYPDDGLTIIVLSNVENDSAILIACDVAARLFDWPAVTAPNGPALSPRQRCGIER
jgi:CubicO group peptidase (beta-lactamase class C family)